MDLRKKTALFILTLITAVGCTTSDTTTTDRSRQPSAAPPPRESAVDDRPVIVAFGDSLAGGFGAEPGKSFPDFLQRDLDRSGYRYRVVNMGISGDTTTGGVERLDSVVSAKPQLVILELGGNDGLRGVPVTETKRNLSRIIERLQNARIQVVLAGMTLPPNYGADYVRSFQKIYTDLASEHHVTLIPGLFEDILKEYRRRPGLMQADGIHPTAAGNEIMAGTVFRYLKPVLKSPAA